MFIVPLTHEQNTARRWPIVSLVLVVLNVVLFLVVELGFEGRRRAAEVAVEQAMSYARFHGDVEVRCRVLASHVERKPPAPPAQDPALVREREERQSKMDALCDEADRAVFALPSFRWGDVPARGGVLTLVSSQFLHGGWLHLFFNMWFLWLTGCNLEDRWGRLVFLAYYLGSGVVAGLAHRFTVGASWVPTIGASGAVAGAMGGFLVVYAATKIRFFYLFFLAFRPKAGTFDAPAYVMLPLWLGTEVLDGVLYGSADGVAHWAHVGGFAFGAAVALGLRLTKLDAHLDAQVEQVSTVVQDARLLEASRLVDDGRAAEAVPLLRGVAAEQPSSIDARLLLLRAAGATSDLRLRAATTVELAGLYLDAGEPKSATELLIELQQSGLAAHAPPHEAIRLGERFARKAMPELAGQCFAMVHARAPRGEPGARAAVAHATLLVRAGRLLEARELLEAARASGATTPDLDARIDAQLEAVRTRSA